MFLYLTISFEDGSLIVLGNLLNLVLRMLNYEWSRKGASKCRRLNILVKAIHTVGNSRLTSKKQAYQRNVCGGAVSEICHPKMPAAAMEFCPGSWRWLCVGRNLVRGLECAWSIRILGNASQ